MDWRTKYHENSPVISSGKLAKEVQQLCQALPAHQNSPGEKGSRAERTSQEVFPRVLAAFPVPLPCSSEFREAKSKPSRTPQKACPHDFHLLCVQQINQLLLQSPGRHHHRSGRNELPHWPSQLKSMCRCPRDVGLGKRARVLAQPGTQTHLKWTI